MPSPSTAAQLAAYIDQRIELRVDDLDIEVDVLDVRSTFGNVHFQVTPVSGRGEQWVSADRCSGYDPPLSEL
jgi:hypothetical protein